MGQTDKSIQGVFIDRDGTIGEAGPDLHPDGFMLYPGFVEALNLLKQNGIKIFSLTNQPDISRGLFRETDMVRQYQNWGFDGVYICPHISGMGCECRKPRPGMLLRAARQHGLDLTRCAVIGDSWRDMQAAENVGAIKILVRTGEGNATRDRLGDVSLDWIANGFFDGVNWLIERTGV